MYNYDRGGNILSKVKYAYTTGTLGATLQTIPYSYGDSNWKDKLTSYNGQEITYDAIGNPLNDGIWSYTWGAGRQLRQMSKTGTTIQFKYDHNGLRTQKIVTENGVTTTTNYTLHGKLITHMSCGNDNLHFFYDAQSRPVKVQHNGTMYTYMHNLQGDIVGLLDNSGTLVVEYKYDAWGKLLSTTGSMADTLGKRNPFRYRGYVYDEECGTYYLESRAYNPEICRFFSIDAPESILDDDDILSANLYTYCNNSPVVNEDGNGEAASNIVGGILGGVSLGTLAALVCKYFNIRGWKKAAIIAAAAAGGAILGALIGPYIAKLGSKVAAKLGLTGAKLAFRKIAKITARQMAHINVPKHLWGRVLKRVTNSGIQRLIKLAVKNGTVSPIGNGAIKFVYRYKGEIISVTGRVIDGVLRISDAWINR